MSPVLVLLIGFALVYVGASGKWEGVWKALGGTTAKKK